MQGIVAAAVAAQVARVVALTGLQAAQAEQECITAVFRAASLDWPG